MKKTKKGSVRCLWPRVAGTAAVDGELRQTVGWGDGAGCRGAPVGRGRQHCPQQAKVEDPAQTSSKDAKNMVGEDHPTGTGAGIAMQQLKFLTVAQLYSRHFSQRMVCPELLNRDYTK